MKFFSLMLFLALCCGSFAQETPLVARPDDLTRTALHNAFIGNTAELIMLAGERERYEKQLANEGRHIVTLSENIATLAASTERPLPNRRETLGIVDNFKRDGETAVFLQLIGATEPRERFRTAQSAHRYERLYRRLNTLANAAGGLIQLQLFPLFQVPIDAFESMTVDRRYLTPEQRRQLYAAREATQPDVHQPPRDAIETVKNWTPRRVETAALQARANATRALDLERLETADWWFRREMMLQQKERPFRDEHAEVVRSIINQATHRQQSLTIADGEDYLQDAELNTRYANLLRQFLLAPSDEATLRQAEEALVQYPRGPIRQELRVVRAIHDQERGEQALADVQFRRIASSNSDWGKRMAGYYEWPAFNPPLAFEQARDKVNARKWEFLWSGADPSIQNRHLSSEEARTKERAWITRMRSLFLLDTFARAFAMPFLPGSVFPRDEIINAAHEVPPEYLVSREGRGDLRSLAKAYAAEKQYADAARTYTQLGDTNAARKYSNKEASRLMNLARDSFSPREQISLYERVLNGYPDYKGRTKAERRLAEARRQSEVIVALTKDELRASSEIAEKTLHVDPQLFDGRKSNGEVSADGVELLTGDRVRYVNKTTNQRVTMTFPEGTGLKALQELYPRRRVEALTAQLNEPREIKRVPLQVEGGALPGFSAAPGLVPLEPNARLRRLYE